MRPRPRIESGRNPALVSSVDRKRIKTLSGLLDSTSRSVPEKLTKGAELARRRAMSARSKAAKLDIMAKRRTDEEGH